MRRRRPTPRAALGASLAVALTTGSGVLLAAGPSPATAASGLQAGCTAPAPKAAGAGSAKAAVKRLVRGVSTDVARQPKVRATSSRAPRRLVKDDRVRCGTGARVARGDTATVRYTAVVWGRSKAVDSTWAREPKTVALPLKKGTLIDGWVEGIPGMRVGGRRVLVVPPSKAYGSQGTSGIPKNATLVFVIDLVGVS